MAVYTYDQPRSEGAANVLKRARQFTELRWTPIEKMPRTALIDSKENPQEPSSYYPAWRPQYALPYSSARTGVGADAPAFKIPLCLGGKFLGAVCA